MLCSVCFAILRSIRSAITVAATVGSARTSEMAFWALFAGLGLLVAPPGHCQEKRGDLLRWIPEDAAAVVHVAGLRDHAEQMTKARWIAALRGTKLGAMIAESPEFAKLQDIDRFVNGVFGTSWVNLRDEVLGKQVVIAYSPATPNARERGLVAIRAPSAERLNSAFAHFSKVLKANGGWKNARSIERNGVRINAVEHDGKQAYYVLDGSFFLLATEEEWAAHAISMRNAETNSGTSEGWRSRIDRAGVRDHLVTLAVRPRSLPGKGDGQGEKPAPPLVRELWQALDAVLVSFSGPEAPQVTLTFQVRPNAAPSLVKKWFTESPPSSAAWTGMPDNAYFASAFRFDPEAAIVLIRELAGVSERKEFDGWLGSALPWMLEKTTPRDLSRWLGPDVAFAVLPPTLEQKYPHYLAAIAVDSGKNDKAGERALAVVRGLASWAVLENNRSRKGKLALRSIDDPLGEIHYLDGLPGNLAEFQPSAALRSGYLIVGSSPASVRAFQPGRHSPQAPQGTPLVRIQVTEFAKMLSERRDLVIRLIRTRTGVERDVAEARLDELRALLSPFRDIWLTQSSGDGQLSWTLHLRPR